MVGQQARPAQRSGLLPVGCLSKQQEWLSLSGLNSALGAEHPLSLSAFTQLLPHPAPHRDAESSYRGLGGLSLCTGVWAVVVSVSGMGALF